MTWGDDGFQRHGAARKGHEGRLQDRFGHRYFAVKDLEGRYLLEADKEWNLHEFGGYGPWHKKYVSSSQLETVGLRRL